MRRVLLPVLLLLVLGAILTGVAAAGPTGPMPPPTINSVPVR